MPELSTKSLAEVSLLHPNHPDIAKVAMRGYGVLGEMTRKNPETIHQRRWCTGVALAFYDALEEIGYEPNMVRRTRGLLQPHYYLGLESDRGPIIVDGTWQQYVPRNKRSPNLPRVAVGTAAEVVDLAANAGVRGGNLVYWEEVRSSSVQSESRRRLDPAPPFDDEMFEGFDNEAHAQLVYRLETEI